MTVQLGRRALLRGTLASGLLCMGATVPACSPARRRQATYQPEHGALQVNMFITITAADVVQLTMHKAEMGQGAIMGFATLVAEELEVDRDAIDIVFADSLPQYKTMGQGPFALHGTGGSSTMSEVFEPLRHAAAAARMMLEAAAAERWGLGAQECEARDGRIHNRRDDRTLSYGTLTRDAARQPVPTAPRLKQPGQFRWIGKPGRRIDSTGKVTGQTPYGIDLSVPDMVCATMIHPPVFGARAQSVDDTAARRLPGVHAVLTLPTGVAVVADKHWQARAAAAEVRVTWHDAPAMSSAALAEALRRHDAPGAVEHRNGTPRRALREGTPFTATYEVPFVAHAPLEPQNCIVHCRGDEAEVWAPCQTPTVLQVAVAQAVGLDMDRVLVHSTFCGGAFGRRLLGDTAAEAARISKHVGRPVKLLWSRRSDMSQGYYRPAACTHVRASVRDGKLHALQMHTLAQPILPDQAESFRGAMPAWVPGAMRDVSGNTVAAMVRANAAVDLVAMEGASDTAYVLPNSKFSYSPYDTPMPVGFWRSVGHSYNCFFMEAVLDELAELAGADALDFRLALLPEHSRQAALLHAVAERADWHTPPRPGHAKGIARHGCFGTEVAQVAEVTIRDGHIVVTRVWCAVDCGLAVNPDVVAAQMEGAIIFGLSAALHQAITLEDGVVQQENFDTFPLLRLHETPQIDVHIMPRDTAPTGVGEPGVPPIAPAVASALHKLTGHRLRQLPLQPAFARIAKDPT